MKKSSATILFALSFLPAPALAQVCRGGVDFAISAAQGQAAVEIDNNSSVYSISGGKGGSRWYGLGSLAVRTYEVREGSTIILGIGGGRTFQYRRTGNARHCLELRGEFGTGPDRPGAVRADESSSAVTFEFISGLPLAAGRSTSVTPFAGFALRYSSVVTQGDLTSQSDKDFYELVTLGAGLTINSVYALQPYIQFPLGRDRKSDPVFGMRLSMSLGARN